MKAKEVRRRFLFGKGKKKEKEENEKKEDWKLTSNNMEFFGEDEKKEPLIDKAEIEEKIVKNNYGDRAEMNTGAYVHLVDDIQERIEAEKVQDVHKYEEVKEAQPEVKTSEPERKPVESINIYASDYIEPKETKVEEPAKKVETKVEEPININKEPNANYTNEVRKPSNLFVNEAEDNIEVERKDERPVYNDYASPTFVSEPKATEPATSSTTLVGSPLVKNLTPVNPSELGLSPELKVKEVTFSFIDCVPLRVDKVEDTEGNLSRKLEQLEDKYSISVLPLDLCGIPDNVVSLKKHRILNINGRKFSDGTTRIVNHEAYSSLINLARDCISRAIEFKVNITKQQSAGHYTFTAPILNTYELTKFISECKNYSPKVYTVSDGSIYIELGALRAKI